MAESWRSAKILAPILSRISETIPFYEDIFVLISYLRLDLLSIKQIIQPNVELVQRQFAKPY